MHFIQLHPFFLILMVFATVVSDCSGGGSDKARASGSPASRISSPAYSSHTTPSPDFVTPPIQGRQAWTYNLKQKRPYDSPPGTPPSPKSQSSSGKTTPVSSGRKMDPGASTSSAAPLRGRPLLRTRVGPRVRLSPLRGNEIPVGAPSPRRSPSQASSPRGSPSQASSHRSSPSQASSPRSPTPAASSSSSSSSRSPSPSPSRSSSPDRPSTAAKIGKALKKTASRIGGCLSGKGC